MNKADRDKFIEELDGKLGSCEGLRGELYKESLREQCALAKRHLFLSTIFLPCLDNLGSPRNYLVLVFLAI